MTVSHPPFAFKSALESIVRDVNTWLARVVFERDVWDVWLEEWSMKSK